MLLPAILSAALALALNTALATAEDPDPTDLHGTYDRLNELPEEKELQPGVENPTPDTDYTPKAKPTADWTQIAGAEFTKAAGATPEASVGVTRYDDNLTAVAFSGPEYGLVGGARCGNPDDSADFEKSHPDSERDCVPVLYRYTDDPVNDKPKHWEEISLPGGTEPGFVGAIAFIDPDRALVVGGTGTYPRREPSYGETIDGGDCATPPTGSSEPYGARCDQAGMARAWLMRADGSFCELRPGAEQDDCPALPADDPQTARFEGMRGLTALDFHRPPGDTEHAELGFAGGLGQLWRWTQGGFDPVPVDNDSPQSALVQTEPDRSGVSGEKPAKLFRFRVRQLRFLPHEIPGAYAVTSGCCSGSDLSTPLALTYSERSNTVNPLDGTSVQPRWIANQLRVSSGFDASLNTHPGSLPETVPGSPLEAPRKPGLDRPDSLYAVPATAFRYTGAWKAPFTLLLTSASRDATVESRSELWCGGSKPTRPQYEDDAGEGAAVPNVFLRLSTARLVAADTSGGVRPNHCLDVDAAVGELRGDDVPGRGRRGLLNLPRTPERTERPTDVPTQVCPGGDCTDASNQLAYADGQSKQPHAPTGEDRLRARLRSLDFALDSYSLNALDVVGATGAAYAVGDHGAIVTRAQGAAGDAEDAEPEPPALGAAVKAPLADPAAYPPQAPPPAGPLAAVPPLAERPREQLQEPRLELLGSPDASHDPVGDKTRTEDVQQIVMSRDGTEGWAVGPQVPQDGRIEDPYFGFTGPQSFYGSPSLYHYAGGAWRRCDALGAPKQLLAPDPACASLAGLREFKHGELKAQVKLISLARVPLERDGDPANDDELELVAVGSNYRGPAQPADDDPVILRYRDGRWGFEERERRMAVSHRLAPGVASEPGGPTGQNPGALVLKDVAFTAPDDGWILAGGQGNFQLNRLFHYDGERWQECARSAGGCASPRIPRAAVEASLRLTAAGGRVYLYGTRTTRQTVTGTSGDASLPTLTQPVILYRERGGEWTHGTGAGEDGGGLDPGCERIETLPENRGWRCLPSPDAGQGRIYGLTVRALAGGRYEGIAIGRFQAQALPPDVAGSAETSGSVPAVKAVLLRLVRAGGRERWAPAPDAGALGDYLAPRLAGSDRWFSAQGLMALSAREGATAAREIVGARRKGRLFAAGGDGRFGLVATDFPQAGTFEEEEWQARPQAVAPDGAGGAWVAFKNTHWGLWHSSGQVFFAHYTDRPHRPVFGEVAHPFGARDLRFTALAGAHDGSLWLGTDTGQIARYDRALGFETVRIPGWDPGRVVTRESAVQAIALDPAGAGIAVGERGRIANLDRTGVALDPAAGRSCARGAPAPCSTGYDLSAAAIAPGTGGAALAGGEQAALLWRPAGEGFRTVARPPAPPGTKITGIAYPGAGRAWLATDTGYVYRGSEAGGGWSWRAENLVGRTVLGGELPLRAIALDGDDRGYAVGDRGLVLYRDGERWQRLRGPGSDDLTAVTLAPGGGSVLIGGRNGVVWTGSGERLELARPAAFFRAPAVQGEERPSEGPLVGPVAGLALVPGERAGAVEAWAALQARGAGTNRLLHYASDESDPLADPQARAQPLPDSPAPRAGELRLAAFGKSDCQSLGFLCSEMIGSGEQAEVLARRVVAAIERERGLELVLHTGDVSDSAGLPANRAARFDDSTAYPPNTALGTTAFTPFHGPLKFRRFTEFVLDPLERSGLAVFGTAGPGDLSRPAYDCNTSPCSSPSDPAKAGENSAWREGMAPRRAPWGAVAPDAPPAGALTIAETPGADDGAQYAPEADVDPDGDGILPRRELRNGARTHYAVELIRADRKIARLIVVDSSLRSLAASDAISNPLERDGQRGWLERMLCFRGHEAASTNVTADCTREPGQQAIVLTNTPTYSYGPSTVDATATDQALLESLYLRYRVSAVVSGRLGWNGRYWATAPGVHEPCPGAAYQESPPQAETHVCGRDETDQATSRAPDPQTAAGDAGSSLSESLRGLGAPPPPEAAALAGAGSATGIVPFVVAASAGGKFGPNGEEQSSPASEGYFHGYTVVRLPEDFDPAGAIVEQRPLIDWLLLRAETHTLRPGQRLRLRGTAREPIGLAGARTPATRYLEIDSPAITHRYDLLEADPEKPYLPRKDADGSYVALDPAIGAVDRQTGRVRAGRGAQGRSFAIAILSVGDKAATWPLVFEPAKSFRAKPAPMIAPPLPPRAPAPSPPQIRVLGQPPVPPPATPPPPAQLPNLADLSLPAPPALPALPQAAAASPVNPPPPPAPPAPPVNPPAQPLALNALLGQVGVNAAPIPPNAPAVNPAPPSGSAARKEAKQRQAATAKSEEGSAQGEAQHLGGDMADSPSGPEGMGATRRERDRPEPSFTAIAQRDQPSAWARGALYGGGLALMAFALAAGWTAGRPTPRRRPPEAPAPAFAEARWRHPHR